MVRLATVSLNESSNNWLLPALLGIATIALYVGAQSIPPNASPAGTPKSGSAIGKLDTTKKTEKTQNQGQCKSDVPPLAETLNCTVVMEPQPKTKEEQARATSLDTLTRRYMWATIFGVCGGIGGVIILIIQTWYLKRSADTAKTSADSAKDAAEASKTSAETALNNLDLVIATERALIEIDLVEATTYIDEMGDEWLGKQKGDYARYGISAKNHGKTVARITRCRISSDCAKREEFSQNRFKMRFESANERLLGSGITTVVENFFFPSFFTQTEWRAVQDEMENAMIRIEVVYQDILKNGPEGRHETSTIFKWDARREEPSRLFKYNVYT